MKGCSSLGKLRFAALVSIGGTKKRSSHLTLIDLKEAVTAVQRRRHMALPFRVTMLSVLLREPGHYRRTSMTVFWQRLLETPVVPRELMPQDLKLEVDQFTRAEATKSARNLAYVVGRAHARQMDVGMRREWRRVLLDHLGTGAEAPPWLGNSVVELIAGHEACYLEHCRRSALSEAA